MKIQKIAILKSYDSNLRFELDEFGSYCSQIGIDCKVFTESESILDYRPDCVLVTSAQDAKLTPFPTYGLINHHRNNYLELPRLLRNVLTYDGYLCFSPKIKQMLGDLMFGLRKLGSLVCPMEFFPMATEYREPTIDVDNPKIALFIPDYSTSKFKQAVAKLLKKYHRLTVITYNEEMDGEYKDRCISASNPTELLQLLNNHGIAICLDSGLQDDDVINPALLKLIASSTITIASHTDLIEKYFGDKLYYLPADTKLTNLYNAIELHIKHIQKSPLYALKRSKEAHEIFLKHFSLDHCFAEFIRFHEQTLVNKGYKPNPNQALERALPSVTYIMRTGGKHRHFLERALDCLVAQQYPDLRVIFVTHARFDYMNEIIEQYPSLKIRVIESIKSKRSEAIRDGMAAVETDLFGLFDDDDELFPNHVRMLVKTFQYHNKRDWRGEIGMVYSGSIHADDTHPVPERGEFRDHKWLNKKEKRAIEHFRLYSSAMMSQHSWFMPNGWLAQSKFIDDELLNDPQIDTCEDLYFELQVAQRGHFAFSAEVTAVHHFHHFGNSTIEDSHKHIPDTQRIALRNFSRVFPTDSMYDTELNLLGKPVSFDPNTFSYQDKSIIEVCTSWYHNPYFPFRTKQVTSPPPVSSTGRRKLKRLLRLPFKSISYALKFICLDRQKKQLYIEKFFVSKEKIGYIATIKKAILHVEKESLGEQTPLIIKVGILDKLKRCLAILNIIKLTSKRKLQ